MRSDNGVDQAEGLRRLLVAGQTRIVTVVAGRAGMGRTSATINLAAALTRSGKDVLVLDENHAPDNLLDCLGLGAHHDLLDVAQGGCSPHDAVVASCNFSVLPAARAMHALAASRQSAGGVSSAGVGLSREEWHRMEAALTEVSSGVDVMLVDGAMLTGQTTTVSSSLSSGAELLVVVDATPSGITDSYVLIKRLALECARLRFSIVVNRVVSEKAAMTVFENMSKVARRNLSVRLDYLGHVPLDERLRHAMQIGRPVIDAFPAAESSKAYMDLAQNLMRQAPKTDDQAGRVAAIIQSLMSQVSGPLHQYSKEVAQVVN